MVWVVLLAMSGAVVVVGAVATWNDKFLLAKRAIHPRKGDV